MVTDASQDGCNFGGALAGGHAVGMFGNHGQIVPGMVEIRGIAVDQLPACKGKLRQEAVGAAGDFLDRVVALEAGQRPLIAVDADVTQGRRLALHDGTTPDVGLDIGVMRWHQDDDRLTQARSRLRAEIATHPG